MPLFTGLSAGSLNLMTGRHAIMGASMTMLIIAMRILIVVRAGGDACLLALLAHLKGAGCIIGRLAGCCIALMLRVYRLARHRRDWLAMCRISRIGRLALGRICRIGRCRVGGVSGCIVEAIPMGPSCCDAC